ncbi:MAG: immunoglobulin domain-containing protein, partial [Verrucomicrobia bacterium]|nr:immunoglobulin domain-containing protein [Verrucomicrobiota bacterium]
HIINASWQQGGLLSGTVSQSMIDALQRLRQDGILFVSSAGNDGDNNDLVAHYPSNYPFDNMVAVAAITRSGTLSRQSNYGERLVDLAAPGDNILSLSSKADNEYTMVSGTSFAAPHVSGMLALLKAQFPSEDYRTLIHRLYAGVSRSDRLIGKVRTGGVANLMKSMSLTSVPEFPEITDFTFNGTTVASEQEVTVTQRSDVAFMVSANGAAPLTFAWRRDGKLINGANTSSLQITDFSAADIAEYQVTISNSAGSATLGMRLLGVIEKPELSEAVNASNRTFLTSGNTLWDGQNVVSRDGISAGASGRVAARQGTMASTQVTGPGKARFFWKVSSERNNDTLDLLVDNVRTDSISGEVDWTRKELTLSEGTHELRWQYVKDASLSKGEDRGYLDQFQFESTAAAAPTILSESRSQAVVEGSAAFLMVLANGAEPLSYQWFKDGAILPDATSNRLDFPSVSANNHGRYSVVVGNEAGTATSGIMLLTVTPQPLPARIAMHPVNKTIQEGGSVSLTASVTGTPPIQYQWRKGNLDLPGQTSLTLTLTDLQVQDSGAYSLRATNPVGSDTSREAQLTVVQLQLAPAITKHPAAVTVNNGDPIELVVEASGLGPFTYVWTRNGVTIPGESEFNFVRPDAVPSDAGEYQVRVISPFGSSLSDAARVHVNVTSQALGQAMDNSEVLWSTGGASPWSMQTSVTWDGVDALQSGVIQDNDFSELTTTVVGPGQISFWWSASSEYGYDFLSFLVDDELIDQISGFWDWEEVIWNIPEGIHTLTWIYFKDEIASDGADAGWLDAFAFASFNTESPVVVRHPQDQSGIVGSEVTIDLEVSGNPPFSYQWFFGGERMDGATGATLTLRDLTSDQQGLYSVVVTNSFGTTTSRAAEVFVFDRAELVDYTLNSPGLNWMDDDAAPWFPQVAVTADGESAMQSGPIGDGGQSSQRTAVSGPGLLYFFWKVSSEEDYDFLDFLIDDELFLYRSGEVDWEDMSILIPPGIHILEWVYTKDEILSDGADAAWLDAVEYIELDAFSYWQQLNFFPGELLDPEISGQDADPDRDGWRNIEEFGFGLDPFSSHNTYRPSARLVQTSIGQVLELTYLRRTDEPNLVYSIALSNDLEKWTMSPASDWEESLIKWDQGLQQVRTRYRIPVGPDSLFARVLIRY